MKTITIPTWQSIAKTYNEAVEKTLADIAKSRPFYNWREGKLGEKYLRETEEKKALMKSLTKGNEITLSFQLGEKYKGKSVKESRTLFEKNEAGLGAYEVGQILLQHPELLSKYEGLWIDCAGDEFSPGGVGAFSGAPFFGFCDDEVVFGACDVDDADGFYGTASGSSPQTILESRPLDSFSSLTLESAIALVKKEGYVVYKLI